MNKADTDKSPFVSVYKPISGWKPIMYHYNQEDQEMPFWEPYETYFTAFHTEKEANLAAVEWAMEEGIRIDPKIQA